MDGGRIGWALAYLIEPLWRPLGVLGRGLAVFVFGGLTILCMLPVLGVAGSLRRWLLQREAPSTALGGTDSQPAVSVAPLMGTAAAQLEAKRKAARLPAEYRKRFRVEPENEESRKAQIERAGHLPGLELLVNEQANRPDERNINLTAGMIEKTLAEFGIPARVVGFRVGPTVTQFAVEPGFMEKQSTGTEGDIARQKVRVAQISSLARDLALALSAERLRIEAPVPGRPYVGIEVPNLRSTVVRLRPILESEAIL